MNARLSKVPRDFFNIGHRRWCSFRKWSASGSSSGHVHQSSSWLATQTQAPLKPNSLMMTFSPFQSHLWSVSFYTWNFFVNCRPHFIFFHYTCPVWTSGTSSKPSYLSEEAPPPNTNTQGMRASTYEFWEDTVHCIAFHQSLPKSCSSHVQDTFVSPQ